MKECSVRITGLDCNQFPKGKCVLMYNEGVPEGRVSAVESAFADLPIRILKTLESNYSPGGPRAGECIASPEIAPKVSAILKRRKDS